MCAMCAWIASTVTVRKPLSDNQNITFFIYFFSVEIFLISSNEECSFFIHKNIVYLVLCHLMYLSYLRFDAFLPNFISILSVRDDN